MCCSKNRDIGTQHDTIADCYDGAVQDTKIEARVEPFSKLNIAAVIDREWGFDVNIVVHQCRQGYHPEASGAL